MFSTNKGVAGDCNQGDLDWQLRLCRHYVKFYISGILKQRDLFFIKQVSFCMIFIWKESC